MRPPQLDAILTELRVAEPYRGLLERMVSAAGSRGPDLVQEFALHLIQMREEGRPEPESLGLAACRRWLRRERIDDSVLTPLSLPGDDGRERERRLEPLPAPAPQVRRQLRWGRRHDIQSIPAPAPDADLRQAVRALPLPERRAIQACFGVGGPRRRGRRSRELLRLAERGLARLRQALPQEHFVAKLF